MACRSLSDLADAGSPACARSTPLLGMGLVDKLERDEREWINHRVLSQR